MTSNALNLLSIYNSDSDSENEVPGARVSVKRCLSDDGNKYTKLLKSERLPVPSILKPPENNTNSIEQSDLHGGRVRTFPHERGNWSTYIYIPYEQNEIMHDLIQDIIEKCKTFLILQPVDDLHISLTKTVILRHHWIESFTKIVGQNLNHLPGFLTLFDNLKIYCNEERTRTFIGLQIKSGHTSLLNLVEILNKCLKEYNLAEFYKDPSFHMSLVWCIGDYEKVLNDIIDDLNGILSEYMASYHQSYWYIHVKNLLCKTGNKLFTFNLNI